MIQAQTITVGKKYRFLSGNIDTIVTITESPIKNDVGFLEFGAIDEDGIYRICFNDELFEITND